MIPPLQFKHGKLSVKIASPTGQNIGNRVVINHHPQPPRVPRVDLVKANIVRAGQSPPKATVNPKLASVRLNTGLISFDPRQAFSINSNSSTTKHARTRTVTMTMPNPASLTLSRRSTTGAQNRKKSANLTSARTKPKLKTRQSSARQTQLSATLAATNETTSIDTRVINHNLHMHNAPITPPAVNNTIVTQHTDVAQQYIEGERVDPITRNPFIGANIASLQGQTRANKLGMISGEKAPTVITDYLGKESPGDLSQKYQSNAASPIL